VDFDVAEYVSRDFAFVILFVAIAMVLIAAALMVRDLFARTGDEQADEPRLERLALGEEPPARTPFGHLVQSFRRLVNEGGPNLGPDTAFLMMLGAGLAIGGILFIWFDNLIVGAVGLLVGALAVLGWLAWRRYRRLELIREHLPDGVELLARAIRSGESVEQAVDLAGDSLTDPLGIEFRRCARHLQMGLSVDAAMRALARRAPIIETRILASAFVVHRQTGGSLPITLERLAAVIRDRMGYRRQFRAQTAASRFSAIFIALIGPAIVAYMLLWQQDYFEPLLVSWAGNLLLALAACLYAAGLVWVYSLIRTDY
jgi:tight adherence protein B